MMNKVNILHYSSLTFSVTGLVCSSGFCYRFLYISANDYLTDMSIQTTKS